MSLLATVLWKEWRDHRASLIAAAIGLPALIALGVNSLPGGFGKDASLPSWAALGGFAIVAFTFFSDVFPGEEQRGTFRFLRRLPGGLPVVFAKLLFVGVLALALAGYGYVCTTTASALMRGGRWFPSVLNLAGAYFLLVAPVAAWMFAVSIWLPRGTLALPAALLVLTVFGLPIWLAFVAHPGMRPYGRELAWTLVWLTATAPIVAAWSFLRGRRQGRGALSAGWRGAAATLLVFAPLYVRTKQRVDLFNSVDPSAATFRIRGETRVSVDGRYAYATVFHEFGGMTWLGKPRGDWHESDGPYHALRIDVKDGSWRELARPGDQTWLAAPMRLHMPVPYVAITDCSAPRDPKQPDSVKSELLDTATGRTLDESTRVEFRDARGARGGAFQREFNSIRLPDGRRVWFADDRLHTETADGGARELPDSRFVEPGRVMPITWKGQGATIGSPLRDGDSVYDCTRERRFAPPEESVVVWVRTGKWIVRPTQHATDSVGCRQRLFDPETRTFSEPRGIGQHDRVSELADDGRLLVVERARNVGRGGPLWLVDPESGQREPVSLPDWMDGETDGCGLAGRTPSGRQVFALWDAHSGKFWWARLDLESSSFHAARGPDQYGSLLVGCTDEESAIVLGHRSSGLHGDFDALFRVHFDSERAELLFPRSR